MKRLVLVLATACVTAPVQSVTAQRPGANEAPVVADRFKQRYGKLLVDSKDAPDWMVRGAGCSLGQMTAIAHGEASVVPAHLCVAIQSAPKVTNATCHKAETKAWGSLAQLFGVQNQSVTNKGNTLTVAGKLLTIQGARLDATWRGVFNGAQVCALQLVWPVSEFDALKASWAERGNQAQSLYTAALQEGRPTGDRCEDLKKSAELLAGIPGNRQLGGQVQNSNLLEEMVRQARGEHCVSEKTLLLALSCTTKGQAIPCASRVRPIIVDAATKAGWKIVGSALSAEAIEGLLSGDQKILRRQTSLSGARYIGLAQISAHKEGNRGKIFFCRGTLDLRVLDSRTGSASETFKFSKKTGGLGLDACLSKAGFFTVLKSAKGMTEAMTKALAD